MTNPLNQEIRLRLNRYLRGESNLEEFEKWFTPAAWEIDDSATEALAAEIALRIAEFTNGDWTEDELREQLAPLAPPDWTVQPVRSGSSFDVVNQPSVTLGRSVVAGK